MSSPAKSLDQLLDGLDDDQKAVVTAIRGTSLCNCGSRHWKD
jgi:hypothetical protein